MDRTNKWTDEDFTLLTQEIDKTFGEVTTSTPGNERQILKEEGQDSSLSKMTPFIRYSHKPRRLLPQTPMSSENMRID